MPIFTEFEDGANAIFQKVPENVFFGSFFSNKNCLRRGKFGQSRVFSWFARAHPNNLINL